MAETTRVLALRITDEDVRRAAGAMPHSDTTCQVPIEDCQRQRLLDAHGVLTAAAYALRARWVAEALDEAAGRLHAQVAEQRGTTWDSLRHAADVVDALAAEYRAGTR